MRRPRPLAFPTRTSASRTLALLSLPGTLALACLFPGAVPAADWPSWRGPRQDGTTPETQFPTRWSPTRNVRWRVELPDRGNSTPVTWGDRIFLTQAVEATRRRNVMAFDRDSGRLLWQAGTEGPAQEETHEDNPYCAASPVTDGTRVVANFGPSGVWAYQLDGKPLWNRDLGPQKHQWGYSSSPVVHGPHVLLYHGPGPTSKLVALDKQTGAIAWQRDLPEPVPTERTDGFKGRTPGTIGNFGSPLITQAGARDELILAFPESVRAYAPHDGRELWRAGGLNPLVYTSPVPADGLILVMGGFFGSSLAIRPGGSGDVTATHRVWRDERSKKNRIGSAVVKDGHVFFVNMEGFFECLDLATGRQLWEERLDGPGANDASWSSVTLAGDRIYALNRSGDGFVLRAAPKFEILATNSVGESLNASPVLSDGEIFIRTWKALWCISEKRRLAGN